MSGRKRAARAGALLLSVLLLASPCAVSAEEPEPVDSAAESANSAAESAERYSISASVSDLLETSLHGAYIHGYSDGSFQPENPITRAEAAQMFYGLLISPPEETGEPPFADVGTQWYAPAVNALGQLGAIGGYPDGTFRPDRGITRAEFVAIAARFAEEKQGENRFSDVAETNWAREAILSACAYGWVSGYPDGTFRPASSIRRSEAVVILNNMLGRSPDPEVDQIRFLEEFWDVSFTHWAYGQICEAATPHDYRIDAGTEYWTLGDEYDGSGWELSEGKVKYRVSEEEDYLAGFQPIQGKTYYFDETTRELLTGWQVIDGKHYLLPDLEAGSGPAVNERYTEINYTASNRSYGDVEYITVHYTASPGDTAYGECGYFETSYRGASAHYFVDETSIWQCVREKDVSWHCGNDVYYHEDCRNYNSIGIEMCSKKRNAADYSSPYDSDWYFADGTVNHTVELVRELMMRYGVPLENVVRHHDISLKICPAPYVTDFSAWRNFLALVSAGGTDYDGSYRAQVTAKELNVRSGPGTGYGIVGVLNAGEIVTVSDASVTKATGTGWVKIERGWVSTQYLCRLG